MDDSEQSSTVVEDGIGDVSVKKRPRKQYLYSQILKQMEFYFSDANLSRDRFMSQYLQKSKEIPIEVFLKFNRIRELTCDLNDIAKALRSSQLICVSEDGKTLSRKTKVKQKENQDDCIIYVEQLPPDANHDWVSGIFSAYGKVEYVAIPKFKNKPVIKGFAFVEFDTPEAARRALEAFGSVGSCLPQQMPPEELRSIAAFEEEGKEQDQGVDESQTQDEEGEKTKKKAKKSEHNPLQDESATVQECEDDDSEPKSKKVKLDESSSEAKENRKSKKIETSTTSNSYLENITEEGEEKEEKEEKNSSASKKARKRKIASEVADLEQENENAEMYASNESQSKKKKKHSFDEKSGNVHTDDESKEDDASGKKKKKHKQKCEDGEDVIENEEGMGLDDNQEVCDFQHSKKKKKKHKHEDGDIIENEGVELDDNQELCDEQHSKKKKKKHNREDGDVNENEEGMEFDDNREVCDTQLSKKKKKRKSEEKDNDTEDVDDDEGTTQKGKTDDNDNEQEAANDGREETDEPVGEASAKKKRSRKRNKDKKKNKKGEDPTFGLRIISKNEWRRLRNKYLNLQREKMQALKKHLARRQYGSVHQSPFASQDGNRQNVRVDPQNIKTGGQEKPGKVSFTPGVIIKITLSSPLMDVTSFKTSAKHCEDVKYVDAKEGDTKAFLRCTSSDGVQKLLLEHKWENMNVLEGDDEKKYWKKIFEDRESKINNKIKVRGKDKLIKRAERELGKHIKFDD